MYWPVAQKKKIGSLEEILQSSARSSRAVEVESEEEEQVNKKRSKSHSTQLHKKISISNINQLNLSDHNLLETVSFLNESSEEEEIHTEMAAFNHNETWCRIKQLAVTSKHYTPRDKNEMLAQEPTFNGIDDLITLAAAINQNANQADLERKARLEHMANNAIAQLKLYYFVGTEGWGTAIATIKSAEATRLGLPEVKQEVKPQIIYVKPQANYQSYNQGNTSSNGYRKKTYGRRPYKKY